MTTSTPTSKAIKAKRRAADKKTTLEVARLTNIFPLDLPKFKGFRSG